MRQPSYSVSTVITEKRSAPPTSYDAFFHGLDPFETFMASPPGQPVRRKADDQVPCDRVVTICA